MRSRTRRHPVPPAGRPARLPRRGAPPRAWARPATSAPADGAGIGLREAQILPGMRVRRVGALPGRRPRRGVIPSLAVTTAPVAGARSRRSSQGSKPNPLRTTSAAPRIASASEGRGWNGMRVGSGPARTQIAHPPRRVCRIMSPRMEKAATTIGRGGPRPARPGRQRGQAASRAARAGRGKVMDVIL